jgi:mono/diheme cytochrome c family protein
MTALRAVLLAFAFVVLLAMVSLLVVAAQPTVSEVTPPRTIPDAALVVRGASVAALGDCIECHTAPGGKPYAGGRALRTPFGTIYGTNITPDAATGIGRWSQAAFVRAMREGVDREGRHLYPAFPYNHFRRVADADLKALYAFLMTRDAVEATTPSNRLAFPFNLRPLIAGWKALYLTRGGAPRIGENGDAGRGAALVEGLGHCGACHTPHNALGGEEDARALAGGEAEGWYAPALTGASLAPVRWTAAELYVYLRGGVPAQHGVAVGPMEPVARNLADAPEADVRAMAAYLATSMGAAPPASGSAAASAPALEATPPAAAGDGAAAAFYAGACALCHDHGRQGAFSGALPLSQSTAVAAPTPRNFVHIVLRGLAPREGESGAAMPGYAGALTQAQLVDVANYVRVRFGQRAPWQDAGAVVQDVMRRPDG